MNEKTMYLLELKVNAITDKLIFILLITFIIAILCGVIYCISIFYGLVISTLLPSWGITTPFLDIFSYLYYLQPIVVSLIISLTSIIIILVKIVVYIDKLETKSKEYNIKMFNLWIITLERNYGIHPDLRQTCLIDGCPTIFHKGRYTSTNNHMAKVHKDELKQFIRSYVVPDDSDLNKEFTCDICYNVNIKHTGFGRCDICCRGVCPNDMIYTPATLLCIECVKE